ncbi:ParB N-terminal domain-containing protein [Vibrio chagasii]|nr:ParB N-terminal domain-containing protein [Vibrio chagasii]CAH6877340.1 ParB N-terminal domain-containing protein [Vibrio chagasii]CAH6878444.1 ParB N-terminal domain-containing protein [Vibrio chagasii]CAH7161714.1 ParB N-terminal domain-containing protein [Vibrio chagasii]CAH7176438.1 ParB N-terminal domain-containing protein [Vibrio chagasii]
MVSETVNWWDKRTLRSVDNLRLWVDNPRLDPIEDHIRLADFIDDLMSDESEKREFMDLARSISSRGFMSFDPIVVWKNEHDKFVVAEGNRRVLALKLLRSPEKAPKSIKRMIVDMSKNIDRDTIEKIRVCVAPSYEATRWYILQRHSTGSLLKRWQRLQQQRFIMSVYEDVGENLDLTAKETGFKKGEVVEALRFVGVRNLATRPEIIDQLTIEEREAVYSHRISMTILERWFGKKYVRESWGIEFDEIDIIIKSDVNSFYSAYAKFLKLMLNPNNELGYAITTRTIDNNFDEIFSALPKVTTVDDTLSTLVKTEKSKTEEEKKAKEEESSKEKLEGKESTEVVKKELKANPDRNQLTSDYYTINVSSYKLEALFKEFKVLPVTRYKHVAAASLRIFLDLSVNEYIASQGFDKELSAKEKMNFSEVKLMRRLQFLQDKISDKLASKVIKELLNHSNDHSLNTLNDYVHGTQTHKVSRRFINGFWDMLTPLLRILVDLKEK